MTALELINKIVPLIANRGNKRVVFELKIITGPNGEYAIHLLDLAEVVDHSIGIIAIRIAQEIK